MTRMADSRLRECARSAALRLDPATLGNVIGIPGGVDSQEASKIRTVVPTAGIAMINFNLRL